MPPTAGTHSRGTFPLHVYLSPRVPCTTAPEVTEQMTCAAACRRCCSGWGSRLSTTGPKDHGVSPSSALLRARRITGWGVAGIAGPYIISESPHPLPCNVQAVLQQLGELLEDLGQAALDGESPRGSTATLATLRRHVGELQVRLPAPLCLPAVLTSSSNLGFVLLLGQHVCTFLSSTAGFICRLGGEGGRGLRCNAALEPGAMRHREACRCTPGTSSIRPPKKQHDTRMGIYFFYSLTHCAELCRAHLHFWPSFRVPTQAANRRHRLPGPLSLSLSGQSKIEIEGIPR